MSGFGAGGGADMLQEVLTRKLREQVAMAEQQHRAKALMEQARQADQSNALGVRRADQGDADLGFRQERAGVTDQRYTDDAPLRAVNLRLHNAQANALENPVQKPTTVPLVRVGRDGKPTVMGDIPSGAKVINEPSPAGPSHPRFNIVQGADADGKPAMIRTNVDTGQIEVLPVPTGANFVKRDQPATADQTNLAIYSSRVKQAEPIIAGLESAIASMNPLSFEAQSRIDKPYLQSKEMQSYSQAARQFVNSVLRRESGAAISQSEFDSARKQYLPMPGDTDQARAQKRAARADLSVQFERGAGPAAQKRPADAGGGGDAAAKAAALLKKYGGG
jgi:hypothetical protein